MDEDLNWRPSVRDIGVAEELLVNATKFQTRLDIVRALAENRDAPLRIVASVAKTRSAVVKAFLRRWRTHGTQSLIASGRLTRLKAAELNELKIKITSGRLKSLRQVQEYVEAWFGPKLDLRTIRSDCGRLGVNLPVSVRAELKLHDSWNETNIAKLSGDDQKLKNRLNAVIRACKEPSVPLRKIVAMCGKPLIPESTLRADLKSIKSKRTLQDFLKRRLRIPAVDRLRLRQEFEDWATEQYEMTGRIPSPRAAVKFLKARGVKIKPKTAYAYFADWKPKAGLRKRKHQRREKFVPSKGLTVRSLL